MPDLPTELWAMVLKFALGTRDEASYLRLADDDELDYEACAVQRALRQVSSSAYHAVTDTAFRKVNKVHSEKTVNDLNALSQSRLAPSVHSIVIRMPAPGRGDKSFYDLCESDQLDLWQWPAVAPGLYTALLPSLPRFQTLMNVWIILQGVRLEYDYRYSSLVQHARNRFVFFWEQAISSVRKFSPRLSKFCVLYDDDPGVAKPTGSWATSVFEPFVGVVNTEMQWRLKPTDELHPATCVTFLLPSMIPQLSFMGGWRSCSYLELTLANSLPKLIAISLVLVNVDQKGLAECIRRSESTLRQVRLESVGGNRMLLDRIPHYGELRDWLGVFAALARCDRLKILHINNLHFGVKRVLSIEPLEAQLIRAVEHVLRVIDLRRESIHLDQRTGTPFKDGGRIGDHPFGPVLTRPGDDLMHIDYDVSAYRRFDE